MPLFDKVGKWTDVHSDSAEKIAYRIEAYLKSTGMGNTDGVLAQLSAQNMSMALLHDTINDVDPKPASKKSRLGVVIRAALVAARKGKGDHATSLDNWAWGAAHYVYLECKGMKFFEPEEYSSPFFQQLVGIMLTEGLKGVAEVAVTYVMKDRKYGKIAADMTGNWLGKSGEAYINRLTKLFDPNKIRDPNKWAERQGLRAQQEQIKKDTLELEKLKIQNGIAMEKINAKYIQLEERKLADQEALYNATKGLNYQQGTVDEKNSVLASLSAQGTEQKKKALTRNLAVGGIVLLSILLLGGVGWKMTHRNQ